jgi:uncharacterized protein (TIGR02270 family)
VQPDPGRQRPHQLSSTARDAPPRPLGSLRAMLEQHAEEAAILWSLRDAAVRAPHVTLPDVARFDDRIEAQLDGLRLGGGTAWKIVRRAVADGDAGEVFAAAVLAAESGRPAWLAAVSEAVTGWRRGRGLASALAWVSASHATPVIDGLLLAPRPVLRRVAVAAAAARWLDLGRRLERAVLDHDAGVRARALRALGELGRVDGLPILRMALLDDDPWCRFWAAWSATLLGDRASTATLRALAETDGAHAGAAAELAVRAMDPSAAARWLDRLAADPRRGRMVVRGLGALGVRGAIPRLLELLDDPRLGRVAGESFTTITGVVIDGDLAAEPPEEDDGPSDDPSDENIAMSPDEHLAWPDAGAVRRRWAAAPVALGEGRHLLGRPIEASWLGSVLASAGQRARAAAAIEVALAAPGAPLFPVRGRGRQQRLRLGRR